MFLEVETSTDYSAFVFHKQKNATASSKQIHSLASSIEKTDFGRMFPIVVVQSPGNDFLYILDGYYRFQARRFLQIPVYYVRLPDVPSVVSAYIEAKRNFLGASRLDSYIDFSVVSVECSALTSFCDTLLPLMNIKDVSFMTRCMAAYNFYAVPPQKYVHTSDFELFVTTGFEFYKRIRPFFENHDSSLLAEAVGYFVKFSTKNKICDMDVLYGALTTRNEPLVFDKHKNMLKAFTAAYNEYAASRGYKTCDFDKYIGKFGNYYNAKR